MKVIKPIKGRPMICHLLDRLKHAQRLNRIVICTSTVAQDDPLESIAQQEGVDCFRGHPDDVLVRLTAAAERFGVDTVVNCTADNPFVDPVCVDRLVDFHLSNKFDCSRSLGIPFGTFAYALSYPAMVHACSIKNEVDTECWSGYFTATGLFKCGVLQIEDPDIHWPDLRLTVDVPEDFEMVSRIFDELYDAKKLFSLQDIVSLCRRRPDIAAINADVQQKAPLAIKVKDNISC